MPTIETVESMDRSMLPVVMTNVSPSARTVRTAAYCRTLVALRSEKKLPLSRENTMIRMTSATRGPTVGIDRRKLSLRESPSFRPVATVFDVGGLIDLPFELRKLRP